MNWNDLTSNWRALEEQQHRSTESERAAIRSRIRGEDLEREAERQEGIGACPLCGALPHPEMPEEIPTCGCLSEAIAEQVRGATR